MLGSCSYGHHISQSHTDSVLPCLLTNRKFALIKKKTGYKVLHKLEFKKKITVKQASLPLQF